MSTISPHRKPARSNGPRGHRLWCPRCDTDDHLVIESIQALQPPKAGLVAAAYTCGNCGYFYSHTATVAQVATVLNRPGAESGILQFGGAYLHCGEPMSTAGGEHRGLYSVVSADQYSDGSLDVYLRTRVLRCRCGFQMEIPD